MTHIAPSHVRRHLLRPQRSNLLCLAAAWAVSAASAWAGEELTLVRDDFGHDFPFLFRQRIPAGDTPEECKGLPREAWIDLQEADYIPRSEER